MSKEQVTVGQASKLLGVCKDTVRKWVDDGKLKAYVTPTGHRRISMAAIREMLK